MSSTTDSPCRASPDCWSRSRRSSKRGRAFDLVDPARRRHRAGRRRRRGAPTLLDLVFSGAHNLLKGGGRRRPAAVGDRPGARYTTTEPQLPDLADRRRPHRDRRALPAGRLHRRPAAEGAALPDAPPRAPARLPRCQRPPPPRREPRTPAQATPRRARRPVPARPRRAPSPAKAATSRSTPTDPRSPAAPRRPSASTSHDRSGSSPTLGTCASSWPRSSGWRRPTARLERAFADHIDCCAYRLDAWLLGLVNRQLDADALTQGARTGRARASISAPTPGSRTCAPETGAARRRSPGDRRPADDVRKPGDPPLMRDPANGGYIPRRRSTRPSTAAVLRNGYLSNASRDTPDTLAVNLTSERVRDALACSRASAPARASATCSATSSSAACTTATGSSRSTVHLRAPQGVPAARRPARIRPDRPRASDRGDRGAQRGRRPRASSSTSSDRQQGLPVRAGRCPPPAPDEAGGDRREVDRCSTRTTRSPTSRWPRACTRRCSATTTASAATLDAYAQGALPAGAGRRPHARAAGIGLTHRVGLHLEPGLAAARRRRARRHRAALAEPAVNAWLADAAARARRRSAARVGCPTPRTAHRADDVVTLGRPRAAARSTLRLLVPTARTRR